MVKREGTLVLKEGRALGGCKRASKIQILRRECAFSGSKQPQIGSEVYRDPARAMGSLHDNQFWAI